MKLQKIFEEKISFFEIILQLERGCIWRYLTPAARLSYPLTVAVYKYNVPMFQSKFLILVKSIFFKWMYL